MPLKTWDTKADFDAVYDIGLEPNGHPNTRLEVRGHYERSTLFNSSDPRLDWVTPEWRAIVAHFSWPLTHKIAVVGCGFGWALEYLESVGYLDVWGTDTSLYIQAEKDKIDPRSGVAHSAKPERIRNENLSTPGTRKRFVLNTIRSGNLFDVIISERVLSSLTDAEVVMASRWLHDSGLLSPTGEVIHIESGPGPDDDSMGWNWKTIDEWKALIPSDTFVESFTASRVL